ncbi:hypothetical protein RB653_001111 [Dictyostelium firmibasis]|uniref:Uncharacterized protein n=1 Tax=Dictyostelium firmibasis TaxID=79012 RepID=A0AAN7U6W0_9MYCE
MWDVLPFLLITLPTSKPLGNKKRTSFKNSNRNSIKRESVSFSFLKKQIFFFYNINSNFYLLLHYYYY